MIRDEEEKDWTAVRALNTSAFETLTEANLVDELRESAQPTVSLIAEKDKKVVGHIMFSPVSLSDYPNTKIMGLAPMAVAPTCWGKGIGSALVHGGLELCKQKRFGAVVVLEAS